MTENREIELDISGPVATLWLNRPQVRNAINTELLDELKRLLERVEGDEQIRVLVVRGRGAGFCAGADLNELGSGQALQAAVREERWVSVFERMANLPVPVVAAVHGFALGGGFLLSLYCDWRLVAEATQLGFPQLAQRLVPPWGLRRVARWVGELRAKQLVIATGVVTASEALRLGLIDEIAEIDRFDEAIEQVATRLAECDRSDIAALRGRLESAPIETPRDGE